MIDDVITVSLTEVAAAIKTMVEHNRVVAEGAGAVPVAAALAGRYRETKVCAVVSGGNLDTRMLATIMQGRLPAG
jgi:threonine dehydratase